MTKKTVDEQISVILPRPLKRWAQAQAKAEGIALAAWVRRLVMARKAA